MRHENMQSAVRLSSQLCLHPEGHPAFQKDTASAASRRYLPAHAASSMIFFCKVPATLGAHLLNAYNWLSSRAPQIQSLLRRLHMASFYIHGAAAPARCRAKRAHCHAKRAHTAERLSFVTVTMCAPHHAGIYYDVANRIARVRYISTRPLSDETAPYQTLGVFILLQLLISGAIERDACPSVAHCMPARDLSLYPQLSTAACSSRTQPVG